MDVIFSMAVFGSVRKWLTHQNCHGSKENYGSRVSLTPNIPSPCFVLTPPCFCQKTGWSIIMCFLSIICNMIFEFVQDWWIPQLVAVLVQRSASSWKCLDDSSHVRFNIDFRLDILHGALVNPKICDLLNCDLVVIHR